MFFVLIVTVQL